MEVLQHEVKFEKLDTVRWTLASRALLQEGRLLGSFICMSLGHSEKCIYFEKHMFCEIRKIVYCTVDFGLFQPKFQEDRFLGIFICGFLGYSERYICFGWKRKPL